ncbi:hypothetical protein H0H92_003546 [Tricholoma furcatifolium]|nr:hypothetical protein H0H92_003546 [Tricholoma furcatifolium]
MSLARSKSAPHGVPGLLLVPPSSLVRAASFHTIEEVVKDVKSDKLGRVRDYVEVEREDAFNLTGFFPKDLEYRWGWVREEEKVEGSLFGASDKMTEAIEKEDKLGVLSLGRMLYEGDYEEERKGLGGVVDELSVWLRYRQDGDWETGKSVDAGDWKTSLDSAIDEYFPIWDISGNSRATKVPHVA